VSLSEGFVVVRARARRMSPEERRSAILDAAIPLLRAHGREVSTRQLAEAAGVAEGTLFRAFGDKDAIIAAAVERYFDPEPLRNALRAIDPDEPTVEKIRQVLELLRARFAGVIGFMSALRHQVEPPRRERPESDWLDILGRTFRPEELGIPVETLGFYLRLLAFGAAMPPITSAHVFTLDELLELVTRGVLPVAASDASDGHGTPEPSETSLPAAARKKD
jgi:AcrR family transcriptional regulator